MKKFLNKKNVIVALITGCIASVCSVLFYFSRKRDAEIEKAIQQAIAERECNIEKTEEV